jgi:hypothetical protein
VSLVNNGSYIKRNGSYIKMYDLWVELNAQILLHGSLMFSKIEFFRVLQSSLHNKSDQKILQQSFHLGSHLQIDMTQETHFYLLVTTYVQVHNLFGHHFIWHEGCQV